VTLALQQVHRSAGQPGPESPTAGEGNHEVLRALPDRRRRVDLAEMEVPRRHQCQVVVQPTVDALAETLADARC